VDAVGSVRPDIQKAVNSAKEAGDGVVGFKSESEKVQREVERLQRRVGGVEVRVERAEGVNEDVEGLVRRVEKVEGVVEDVRREFADVVENCADKEEVAVLDGKVDEVENGILELLRMQKEREVVLVRDSMEGLGRLIQGKESGVAQGRTYLSVESRKLLTDRRAK
jgi:archaellum component FlaC